LSYGRVCFLRFLSFPSGLRIQRVCPVRVNGYKTHRIL